MADTTSCRRRAVLRQTTVTPSTTTSRRRASRASRVPKSKSRTKMFVDHNPLHAAVLLAQSRHSTNLEDLEPFIDLEQEMGVEGHKWSLVIPDGPPSNSSSAAARSLRRDSRPHERWVGLEAIQGLCSEELHGDDGVLPRELSLFHESQRPGCSGCRCCFFPHTRNLQQQLSPLTRDKLVETLRQLLLADQTTTPWKPVQRTVPMAFMTMDLSVLLTFQNIFQCNFECCSTEI